MSSFVAAETPVFPRAKVKLVFMESDDAAKETADSQNLNSLRELLGQN